jgi:hypothetical protein
LEAKVVEKRGVKSLGDLSLVAMDPKTGRPEPPEDMRRLEKDVWQSVVGSMPRAWFGAETHELLRGFCRHAFATRTLGDRYAELLDAGPPPAGEGIMLYWEQIDALGSQHDRESRAMLSFACKLRIAKLQRQSGRKDEVELRNAPKRRVWEE